MKSTLRSRPHSHLDYPVLGDCDPVGHAPCSADARPSAGDRSCAHFAAAAKIRRRLICFGTHTSLVSTDNVPEWQRLALLCRHAAAAAAGHMNRPANQLGAANITAAAAEAGCCCAWDPHKPPTPRAASHSAPATRLLAPRLLQVDISAHEELPFQPTPFWMCLSSFTQGFFSSCSH